MLSFLQNHYAEIFLLLISVSLFLYALLDGADLGIGLMFPFVAESERDRMISTIAPFWDANETWLVAAIGILIVAFPFAQGDVAGALYLPIVFQLMGLAFRGAAFDFRAKVKSNYKGFWDKAFFAGSFVAALCQGYMVGRFITGFEDSLFSRLLGVSFALTLCALYISLGLAWLNLKTSKDLYSALILKMKRYLPIALTLAALSFLLSLFAAQSFWSELLQPTKAIPAFILVLLGGSLTFLALKELNHLARLPEEKNSIKVFLYLAVLVFSLVSFISLGTFPYTVPFEKTAAETASETASLQFMLIGSAIVLPSILLYTLFVHKVFWGKLESISYH